MLTYAFTRKDELEKLLAAFNAKPEAMYFSPWSFVDFDRKIDNNTWNKLQLIAVHGDGIKGFLSATISRETLSISQISVCKFCEGHDLEFAADLATIFDFLRRHFRNIRWTCADGCPTQRFYERIVMDQGGRTVGRTRQEHRLRDNRLVDVFYYEVPGNPEPDGVTMIPERWGF